MAALPQVGMSDLHDRLGVTVLGCRYSMPGGGQEMWGRVMPGSFGCSTGHIQRRH